MIRVNLIGTSRKKPVKAKANIAVPTSVMPLILLLIVLGALAGGYLWYRSLDQQLKDLDSQIAAAQLLKQQLDDVIKTNQINETRKKSLENRIAVIEGLKRNQVNPVLALDVLSEAVERTKYVWLSQLDQNNATLSMAGTGTSLIAIADFVANLENSGYFRNPELANATDTAGNYTFSLKCDFAAPSTQTVKPPAAGTGGGQ
jgi:type IV pilus assembly protein PilN